MLLPSPRENNLFSMAPSMRLASLTLLYNEAMANYLIVCPKSRTELVLSLKR